MCGFRHTVFWGRYGKDGKKSGMLVLMKDTFIHDRETKGVIQLPENRKGDTHALVFLKKNQRNSDVL